MKEADSDFGFASPWSLTYLLEEAKAQLLARYRKSCIYGSTIYPQVVNILLVYIWETNSEITLPVPLCENIQHTISGGRDCAIARYRC